MYFTCVFTPLLFTAHPVHFLFIKLHADISPIPGHHVTSNDVCLAPASPTCETRCAQGYQSGDPSGQGKAYLKGQQFHWLHHHYFECNCTCQQLDPSHSQRSKEAAFCRRRLRPRAVRSHLRDVPQRQPGNRAGGGALRRSAGGAQGRRRQGQSGVSVVPPRPVFVFAQTVACCTPAPAAAPHSNWSWRRGGCKPATRTQDGAPAVVRNATEYVARSISGRPRQDLPESQHCTRVRFCLPFFFSLPPPRINRGAGAVPKEM